MEQKIKARNKSKHAPKKPFGFPPKGKNPEKDKIASIEVVDVYYLRLNGDQHFGTVHIYVPFWDMDIRGCTWSIRDKVYIFRLPSMTITDPETGEKNRFPVVSFTSREHQKDFIIQAKMLAKKPIFEFLKARIQAQGSPASAEQSSTASPHQSAPLEDAKS